MDSFPFSLEGAVNLNVQQVLVQGNASGAVLATKDPLSFWGGVNPETGFIIDAHHELCGQNISNRIFVLPSGRGSCTGSVVLLECLLNGTAPSAIILKEVDDIIALGVILAEEMFSRSIPVVVLDDDAFEKAIFVKHLALHDNGCQICIDRGESYGASTVRA